MFTEAEQVIIQQVFSLPEIEQSYKIHLLKLKAIKVRVTGTPDKECFCNIFKSVFLFDTILHP